MPIQQPAATAPSRGVSTQSAGKAAIKLIPASDWPKHHTWPPIGGLRHLIFNAERNGFSQVIRRVGRRVLIDQDAFFVWVAQQEGK